MSLVMVQELWISSPPLPESWRSLWKSVQGAAGWSERHVSDGQANTGRLYALYVSETQRWDVRISDKAEQPRDVAWLRKHAPCTDPRSEHLGNTAVPYYSDRLANSWHAAATGGLPWDTSEIQLQLRAGNWVP